jgi:hypothetical protein
MALFVDCVLLAMKCDVCAYVTGIIYIYIHIYIMVTAVGLTPGGSSTVHIYTQTVHRTRITIKIHELHNQTQNVQPYVKL